MFNPRSRVKVIVNKSVTKKIPTQTASRWTVLIPSLTTVLLIIFYFIGILMNGDIKPFTKSGFFCDDSTIKYPYKKDTIDLKMLMLLGLVIPGLVIKVCDNVLMNLVKNKENQKKDSIKFSKTRRRKISDDVIQLDVDEEQQLNVVDTKKSTIRRLLSRDTDAASSELPNQTTYDSEDDIIDEDVTLFTQVPLDSDEEQVNYRNNYNKMTRPFGEFQLFFFGFCSTILLTGIGKITIGNLRPHFYQRCMPSVDCSSPINANKYIVDFTCTNSELQPRDLSYITTSWPSGHSAVMFYSMLYLIFHLNRVIPAMVQLCSTKVKQRFDPLILYAVYVLSFSLACFIALTRISDYHHHVLDVISGSVIGSLIGVALAKGLPRRYLDCLEPESSRE